MCNDGQTIETIDRFEGNKIWIRARVMDVGFRAVFYYSTDGKYFLPIGNELSMGLGLVWTANRLPYSILVRRKREKTDIPILIGSVSPINNKRRG